MIYIAVLLTLTEMLSTRDIRAIYLFQYKKGLSAAEAARDINQTLGGDTCNVRTVSRWFHKFKDGDFNLENEPRGRPTSAIDDVILKEEVERDSSTTVRCLAKKFETSISTISRHLATIGKVKKLDRWVPHLLTDANKLRRLEIASSLINRNKVELF